MRALGCAIALGLVVAAAAAAKEIPPGSLLVCGAKHCRAVASPADARAFSALFWGQGRIVRTATPRVGSPVFALRFRAGPPLALITATAVRVHGLNCGRFRRGVWYRLPPRLRGVGAGLEPRRLTASIPRSC